MFYSSELFCHRRGGNLARCWLAATLNEKIFKKYCKPHLLQKIDVYNTCEEILTNQIRNRSSYGKFSLYLSAQLMYGITKILFYQTKHFQDYLFKAYLKLITEHRPEQEFDVRNALDVPDVPFPNEVFRNLETSSDLHLITEEPYTSAIEHMMQDKMNFGILLNHEMENFIFLGGEEQSLNEIRRLPWNVSEEAIREPDEPLVNVDMFEIEEEMRSASARGNQREFIVTSEDDLLTRLSTNFRKRIAKPTEEISPKKRKTSHEEAILLEPISIPELGTNTVPVLEHPQNQVQQPPEDEELIEAIKSKRKRKIYDKHNQISDVVMNKNIHDVTAHTIKQHIFTTTSPPAKEYLRQPSTLIFNRPWGESLIKLFKRHIVRPFVVRNEFQTADMEIEETIETIRAHASELLDQTAEISSKIGTIINETTNQSKMLDKTLPAIRQPKEFRESQQTEKKEESIVDLPEFIYIKDKNGEIQEKQQTSANGRKSNSRSQFSSPRSEIHLSKQDMLAFMEVQWLEKRLLNFHELFPPESYSRREVSLAFFFCLELQKEKVIILKQADPFDTIWIEKCPFYS